MATESNHSKQKYTNIQHTELYLQMKPFLRTLKMMGMFFPDETGEAWRFLAFQIYNYAVVLVTFFPSLCSLYGIAVAPTCERLPLILRVAVFCFYANATIVVYYMGKFSTEKTTLQNLFHVLSSLLEELQIPVHFLPRRVKKLQYGILAVTVYCIVGGTLAYQDWIPILPLMETGSPVLRSIRWLFLSTALTNILLLSAFVCYVCFILNLLTECQKLMNCAIKQSLGHSDHYLHQERDADFGSHKRRYGALMEAVLEADETLCRQIFFLLISLGASVSLMTYLTLLAGLHWAFPTIGGIVCVSAFSFLIYMCSECGEVNAQVVDDSQQYDIRKC